MDYHDLKVLPEFFEDILSGKKNFELRKDDRGYQVGDAFLLREWTPEHGYTGRAYANRIDQILRDCPEYGLMDGYIIFYWYSAEAVKPDGEISTDRLTATVDDMIWVLNKGQPYLLRKNDEAYNEIKKLAYYEELERQGKLLELPCAIGDIVYNVVLGDYELNILKMKVRDISQFGSIRKGKVWNVYMVDDYTKTYSYRSFRDFGRKCFLTEEEAKFSLEKEKAGMESLCKLFVDVLSKN